MDDLDLEDVKKLMNNKLVKKKALKDLFIKKIRHMKSLKRMSIPVSISCGKDVKKPLSKCNANEYIISNLKDQTDYIIMEYTEEMEDY